ncbi:MAG: NAD(P)-binding domain-containing protein [Candidatus Limnocylindrales bacterium]
MQQARNTEHHDVIVIGAGQVGLAAGYHLARADIDHVILEAADRVGDIWRTRYDSLRLYSPAKYDSLPGWPFPARGRSFPTGHQMGDYLEAYAERFDLPVRTRARAEALTAHEGGTYAVSTRPVSYHAAHVILATGAFQRPHVPAFAAALDPAIVQLHSADYRNPGQLPNGASLVVGASHSGADIAWELALTRPTYLSGRSHGQLPFSVDGRIGVMAWPIMKAVVSSMLTLATPIGRKMAPKVRNGGGPLLRYRRQDLIEAGVHWSEARVVGATDGKPTLADGTVLDVASVVWCTGFRPDYSWIDLPILDAAGWPVQERGVIGASPGLYVLGIPFLRGFASMLVLGADGDARHVVDHVRASLERPSRDGHTGHLAAQHR